MNLQEAIKNLNLAVTRYPHILDDDILDAIKLGIEALKRCEYIKEHTDRWAGVLLPGETSD